MRKLLVIFVLSVIYTGHTMCRNPNFAPMKFRQTEDDLERIFGRNPFRNHSNIKYYDLVKCGYVKNNVISWPVQILTGDSKCGGSLINAETVLTSAKCATEFQQSSDSLLRIGYGDQRKKKGILANFFDGFNDDGNFGYYKIPLEGTKVVIHPDYKSETSENDIALIQLKDALDNEKVAVVCLPFYKNLAEAPEKLEFRRVVTLNPDPERPILMDQWMNFHKSEECDVIFNTIMDDRICASNNALQFPPCEDDVGYPLQAHNEYKYFQYGLSSEFLAPCKQQPFVSTNIVLYLTWILDNTK